jgi:hypothetical protein
MLADVRIGYMRATDFFIFEPRDPTVMTDGLDPWTIDYMVEVFNLPLVESLRRNPADEYLDIEVAVALADLVHRQLEAYGTSGDQKLSDDELASAIQTLRAVLRRLDINLELPYRNFSSFRTYWLRNGASNSWQARREILADQFEPLHARLIRMEDLTLESLADPVSPRTSTGWSEVDEEIRELRRRFLSAQTNQDYRAIGTHCVGVLEALSRTIYDPVKHLREGEQPPPVDKSKQRLGRYVEVALPGKGNEELRGLVNKSIEFAHSVKHAHTPTRRDAGIAADAVIVLANILRRLEQEL